MTTKYTQVPSSDVTSAIDAARAGIAADVDAVRPPKLAAVVLGGGYGRGEGGVLHTPDGDRLYNDLDFFVFTDGAGRRDRDRIAEALRPVSEKWEKRLNVAVDFSPAKNFTNLRSVARTLMFQELVRGWRPVWGDVDLDRLIPALEPEKLPFSEAARLLLNRGMGLFFAGEHLADGVNDADFIVRNLHKAALGAGDALLLAVKKYRWRGAERLEALREYAQDTALPPEFVAGYERAWRYKLEPRPVLPDDPWAMWKKNRLFLLEAFRRISGAGSAADASAVARGLHERAARERSWKNPLRRLRGRCPGTCAVLFDPPVVTVAALLCAALTAATADAPRYPAQLYRLWLKFN